MSKLKSFVCILLMGIVMVTQAQTQQGYVKTLGRNNKPGVALGGVSVRVRGGHNAVLSGPNGKFSIQLVGKKPGDEYRLQQVQKQGYELKEKEVIGRPYAYSTTVPLTIVMVSPKAHQEELQRIENGIYAAVGNKYKKDLVSLEKQKENNKITIEQYRQQIRELQDNFEKAQGLIESLAEHYACVDYDYLDDKEREINSCIENGELDRAEQLLQQLDVEKRLVEIEQRIKAGNRLLAEANEEMARVLKQQEKDAEYLYQLYTFALARFDNDSARYFIERRAELDSTNVQWQLDAGDFMQMYLSDYEKAHDYYGKSLAQNLSKYGENHPFTAKCYQRLVGLYYIMGDYDNADKYYKLADKALDGYEEDNIDLLAESIVLLGTLCSAHRVYDSAIESFETALPVIQEYYGERSSEAATCWGHLGAAYYSVGNINKSLECYLKCAKIREENPKERKDNVYRAYNHLAMAYARKGEYQQAITYCEKALNGMLKTYGKKHWEIATCYRNFMNVYQANYDFSSALSYAQKGLDIMTQLVGNDNLNLAVFYDDISNIYNKTSHFEDALKYAGKALEIRRKSLGESHPDVASSYHLLAGIANGIKDYSQSRLFLEAALAIYQKNVDNNLVGIAAVCNDLGTVCGYQHDFVNANNYFQKAILYKKEMYGDHHIEMAITYGNIAIMYEQKGDDKKAMEYWKKSIDIRISTFGEYSDNVANTYMYVGTMSYKNREFKRALMYFEKAFEIYKQIHGENHQNTKTAFANVNATKRML